MKPAVMLLFICLAVSMKGQKVHTTSGKVVRIENFQSEFIQPRNVDVWLPEDYNPQNEYAVLYMHDGQMLFDSTSTWNKQEWQVDEVAGRMQQEGSISNCLVVGVWNNGAYRHAEYFPQKPVQFLPEQIRAGLTAQNLKGNPMSDQYLLFLTKELKPYIDSHFSTKTDAANTLIMGSSMGGLISMYALCEYPEIFGGAACLSTHWVGTFERNEPIPEAFVTYLKHHLPDPATHRLYFDYGTETLDSLYEDYQLRVDEVLKEKGYTQLNWMTKKFPGADHSEKAWASRLHIPLQFLLGGKTE